MSFTPFNSMSLPYAGRGAGRRDEFGSVVPPGGRVVAYVHHSGEARLDDTLQQVPVLKTLNQALNACRAGYGDTVLVLPGHAESISVADQMSNLKAGTRIIGLGHGNSRPSLTWAVAAASFLIDQENVLISNMRLLMEPGTGTVTVTGPMTVSSPGFILDSCYIRMGTDANNKVGIGITTSAGGADMTVCNCEVFSATASAITTAIRFVSAVRAKLIDCNFIVGTSADAVGAVQLLTAATDIVVQGCIFSNTRATATSAFVGVAGMTGVIRNSLACIGAAVVANTGFTTMGNMCIGNGVYITSDDATVPEIYPGAT